MNKENILEAVKSMPNEVSFEELMDRMLIVEKIERGEKDISTGNLIDDEHLKDDITQWQR